MLKANTYQNLVEI